MTKKYTEKAGMNYKLFGYNYEAKYDNLRKETKNEESNGVPIAKGQPKKLSKIDYGFTLLDGELQTFQLIWEKRTNYKKGDIQDYLTIEGTMKEIIDRIMEYPIFINDNEGRNFLKKLFVEYEPKLPVIKKRHIVTKQFKAQDNPDEYQEFLEMTENWTEAMQYTFGTYFINYHFNQYFLRNKWSKVDKIQVPFLIGDEGAWKTPISVMIELPDHPQQDSFNGNLSRTLGERPNTFASVRDSLALPSRGIILDESGDLLLSNNGQSNRLNKQFENLLLQFGKFELPSRKSRTGDYTIRQSWTGYPMVIFNDDVRFLKALNKRVDKIQFSEPYELQENIGWLEADWLISNLQSLFYAVAHWIFKYPETVYDIQAIKDYVWGNLGAPWLAEAKNQTVEDTDNQISTYITEIRGYLKHYRVDINDENSIRQYFIEQGIIRIAKNEEDIYWIQGLRSNTGLIPWFKRVIKDNSMKHTEAWEILKEIFNISEEDYQNRPRCKGKPERPRNTYLIDDEKVFNNINIE